MDIITVEFNGKRLTYPTSTLFYVQVGKGKKGSYKTVASSHSLGQMVTRFNGINIGLGYKKRIWCPTFNKKVLVSVLS